MKCVWKETLFKKLFHSKIAIKVSLLQTKVKDILQVGIYNPRSLCKIEKSPWMNSWNIFIHSITIIHSFQLPVIPQIT